MNADTDCHLWFRIPAPFSCDDGQRCAALLALRAGESDRLRQAIITVAIAPGEKLNIRSLCDRFGVGLSPMREALSRLSSEGLVTQIDHRGFAVTGLSEVDLIDLTRARSWLNELAIRNSVANGDAAWEENNARGAPAETIAQPGNRFI